ncbi:hypothetical protein IFM89_037248 [Coptis chinensis]|uniref:8-amino-7-oxononanoate synthase n=1 Tax=Coptis chinensis TaxID=261450 RepID=A0A835LY89_9MAGN|nr:hypothetical protein IFM89_037248 [Coptis chinensis]
MGPFLVEIQLSNSLSGEWVHNVPSSRGNGNMKPPGSLRKLIHFSGNDYPGLSSHPTVCRAAAEAALQHGMGPRGSALICGYTDYHRLLESCLADLKKKEVLLC